VEPFRETFTPVSRTDFVAWTVAFTLFLVYAAFSTSGFLFVDYANLMIHEAGHVFFSWAGYYTQILGGTLLQLIVPLACVVVFVRRGETVGVAVTSFWLFENLLYVAAYMADARRSAMPLVGGDESDWTILFTHWGVLQHDLAIAAWTRGIGWIGMLGVIGWFAWTYARNRDNYHSHVP
jgi:hypothetical protein